MSKSASLFLVFLICFNLYSSIALNSEAASKKQLISLLSAQTDYVIDDVLQLIQSLLQTSQDELSTLESDWPGIEAAKQGTVDIFTDLVNEKTTKCSDLSAANAELAEEIAETEAQIAKDSAQIVKNNEAVEILLNARCTDNRNYISGLKTNKQLLQLLQILIDAVNNFNPSLLEKKNLRVVANKFVNFLQFASKQHLSSLAQVLQDVPEIPDVQERTSEEIGTGHIDNTQDAIGIADFDSKTIEDLQSIKTKVVNLLEEFIVEIQAAIVSNEANEGKANEDVSDYEANIESENAYLTTEIATLTADLAVLVSEKSASDEAVATCETELTELQTSLANAQADLEAAIENFNSNQARLNDEVALFQEVYNLYESEVASASEALKTEVDEELNADEGSFVEEKEEVKKISTHRPHSYKI